MLCEQRSNAHLVVRVSRDLVAVVELVRCEAFFALRSQLVSHGLQVCLVWLVHRKPVLISASVPVLSRLQQWLYLEPGLLQAATATRSAQVALSHILCLDPSQLV